METLRIGYDVDFSFLSSVYSYLYEKEYLFANILLPRVVSDATS